MEAAGFSADFCDRLTRLIPAERLSAAVEHFCDPRPVALRVNTLKTDPAAAAKALRADGFSVSEVEWSPAALLADASQRAALVRHPLVESGALYPQGLASQLAAFALHPQPGESVLDLCAAPGGKTLDLAQRLGAGGDLAAVEASKPRFFRLRANLERADAGFVRTYLHDGRRTGDKVPGRFDAVLLDAPCSGDTRLRGEGDASAWSVKKARRLASKQQQLLESALRCVRPSGRVIYATCSMGPEENEAVVDAVLRGGLAVAEPLALPQGLSAPGLAAWSGRTFVGGVSHSRRVLPAGPMEGFFLASLRRVG